MQNYISYKTTKISGQHCKSISKNEVAICVCEMSDF